MFMSKVDQHQYHHHYHLGIRRVWKTALEKGEDGVLLTSVDLHLQNEFFILYNICPSCLLEHGGARLKSTARPNMLKGAQDLVVLAVLLVAKLVAGEAQHC